MIITSMKTSGKPNKDSSRNAMPGVFALFSRTLRMASEERMRLAGYAAWLIMPPLAVFGLSFLPLPAPWATIVEYLVLVGDILLGIWINACLALIGLSHVQRVEWDDRMLTEKALKAFPLLIALFAFAFLCVVGGTYLLLLPGLVAFVWLAFIDVIALDDPSARFSEAITRSRDLSKGRFLETFWRLVGGNGLFALLYLLLCLAVFSFLFALAGIDPVALLNTLLLDEPALPAWIPLLLATLSLPFVPYLALYQVTLYEALKKA